MHAADLVAASRGAVVAALLQENNKQRRCAALWNTLVLTTLTPNYAAGRPLCSVTVCCCVRFLGPRGGTPRFINEFWLSLVSFRGLPRCPDSTCQAGACPAPHAREPLIQCPKDDKAVLCCRIALRVADPAQRAEDKARAPRCPWRSGPPTGRMLSLFHAGVGWEPGRRARWG